MDITKIELIQGVLQMNTSPRNSLVIESIPPADDVRKRLSENVREARILRSLLRLAERKEKQAAGVSPA